MTARTGAVDSALARLLSRDRSRFVPNLNALVRARPSAAARVSRLRSRLLARLAMDRERRRRSVKRRGANACDAVARCMSAGPRPQPSTLNPRHHIGESRPSREGADADRPFDRP